MREKLHGLESELQQFQEKRIHDFDQQKRLQSEAEKTLQSDVLSLQTQLHFQEKELNDMKEQYRLLVQKGHNPTMIPMSPVVQSKRSKAERNRQDDESGFPSERSFLESMALQAEHSTQTSTSTTEQGLYVLLAKVSGDGSQLVGYGLITLNTLVYHQG